MNPHMSHMIQGIPPQHYAAAAAAAANTASTGAFNETTPQ